ncbi:MAG: MFS transporter [Planctomycetaceae bacterium]|nr:MFS transporter [Planctomycetaceae bacterium]
MTKMYRDTPEDIEGMPSGIPYIVGNEAAERYSFYGMKSILMVFLTTHVFMKTEFDDSGVNYTEQQAEALATQWIHWFNVAVYLLPFIGALIADWLFGKYKTILALSIVYCAGHFVLAIDESIWGMGAGLGLIAFGAGGIKPCVSAHVGDQFGASNQVLLPRVFSWFYFSINIGAMCSMIITPLILRWTVDDYGGAIAFGIPGILMLIATIMFWIGRKHFVHIPPRGDQFFSEIFNSEGIKAITALLPVFLLTAVFFSCFDQTASKWVAQGKKMDGQFLGLEILPDQMQSLNPILVLLFIPLFSYVLYPRMDAIISLTPLRKMGIGFFVTAAAFSCSALIEEQISKAVELSIIWQGIPYLLITAAEIMISITALEFAYSQSPKSSKSLVMAVYLGCISLGNAVTAITNAIITKPDGSSLLPGANYYWFFTGMVLVAGILFIGVSKVYWGQSFLEADHEPVGNEE